MREPNLLARQFADQLRAINDTKKREQSALETAEKLHVSTAGAGLTFLYESLRNASENADEKLLLERAVRRFFKRA